MNVRIYEEEIIKILDSYVKDKFSLEKGDSYIHYDNDEELKGLNFSFWSKDEE